MTRPARATNPWLALLVLCLGNFTILLDSTIVNTAAPRIMSSIGASIDDMLWIINAYVLVFASLLILFGRVGDLIGARNAFVSGLLLFNIASVLCGLSQSPGQLIAARVLQGVGAAMLVPQAIVLISGIFPPERRGAAFGILTAVTGIAAISGPVAGGLLVTAFNWQWIFYLNLPIGLIGIVLTFLLVPDLRIKRRQRFDAVGVLLASGGLVAITFALIDGQRYDWGTIAGPVSIPLVIILGLVLLVGFVLWERRHPDPLVPMSLLRKRNFGIASTINVTVSFALFGLLIAFILETQTLLGMSPMKSGLASLPMTLTMTALAPLAGRMSDRVGGRRLLMFGLTTFAIGMTLLAIVSSGTATVLTFTGPLIVCGLGLGFVFAPMVTEAMRDVTPEESSAASGIVNTARQLGSALGAAVIGAILQNRLLAAMDGNATHAASKVPAAYRPQFLDGFRQAAHRGLELGSGQSGISLPSGIPASLKDTVARLVHDVFVSSFVSAMRPTLAVVVVVLLLSAVLAAFLVDRRPAARPAPAAAEPVPVESEV